MISEDNRNGIPNADMIAHAAAIVAAYIQTGRMHASEIPAFIRGVHAALASLSSPATTVPEKPAPTPAVNPKKSVHEDFIICLEDGKKFKSLKRHIATHYGMTPDQYREKWGLDPSYPMVAPAYAAARSALAKKMGLGRKPVARKH